MTERIKNCSAPKKALLLWSSNVIFAVLYIVYLVYRCAHKYIQCTSICSLNVKCIRK